jgi:hypothetical protein
VLEEHSRRLVEDLCGIAARVVERSAAKQLADLAR